MKYKATTLETIRKLSLTDGDVLVVRKWAGFDEEAQKDITASVRKQLRHSSNNVTLLFVNSFSDVRVLNEEQMRKNGWQRI